MTNLVRNSCNWQPGMRGFDLLTNMCDYFEIGSKAGEDVWLEGQMVGPDGEYLFNGRLFHRGGHGGVVIDSFPKAVPDGWTKRPSLDGDGYDLIDDQGELIFGYRIRPDGVCAVSLSLYKEDGTVAATSGQGGLVIEGVQAMIGRNGIVMG